MEATKDIMSKLKHGLADLKRQRAELPNDFMPSPRPVFPLILASTPLGNYKEVRSSTRTPKMTFRLDKNKI